MQSSDMSPASSEDYTETTDYLPVNDRFDAIEAYRAFDDGGLAEAPSAFSAYLNSQRNLSR